VMAGIRGMALPVVLLILMGLTALGHGALLLSRRELQSAWSYRGFLRAQSAAEIGLHLASAVPPEPERNRDPWKAYLVVSGETDDGLAYSTVRRWLSPEFFLLESRGQARGWSGERTVRWVGRLGDKEQEEDP